MPLDCFKNLAVRHRAGIGRASGGHRAGIGRRFSRSIFIRNTFISRNWYHNSRIALAGGFLSSFLAAELLQNFSRAVTGRQPPANRPRFSRRIFIRNTFISRNLHHNSRIALAEGFLSSFLAARLLQNFSRAVTGRQPAANRPTTGGQRAEVLQKYFH